MPYLVQIATAIVTALLGYISRHSDQYLEAVFSKLGGIISHNVGDTAAIIINTNPNVSVEFDTGIGEVVKKVADDKGYTVFKQDLKKGQVVKISAYGQGYISGEAEIVVDNEQVTYCVVIKLKKRRSARKEG